MDANKTKSKIKHDIKNALFRIESIFDILLSEENSPFSQEELSKDLKSTLKDLNDYSNKLLK